MILEQYNNLKQKCINESEEITVFGEGNLKSNMVLIGEAPGSKEVEMVKPFVGQAGKNLDYFLDMLELQREEIYITNVVKIRPYKINEKTNRKSNRPPKKEEVKLYKTYLYEELKIIKPSIVVTLGNVPLRTIIKDNKITIGKVHGKLIDTKEEYKVFPLYHPASIIYNRSLEKVYINDLYVLKDIMSSKE